MEILNLFPIPVFKFKYSEHATFKSKAMEYLNVDSVYANNTREYSGLEFTSPELHRHPIFSEFAKWAHDNTSTAMETLGFYGNHQITSLWATRHRDQVGHHPHQHSNSFMAGVYYLNGTEKNSGTTFYNVHDLWERIVPATLPNKRLPVNSSTTLPFDEGTLLIFPSWLKHRVAPNQLGSSGSVRHVLAFNSMPVGMTNTDEFDRYNYQDISTAEMITTSHHKQPTN